MFKKPFSVLAAFALGLVISVSIMACADDLQEIVNCNCNDTIKELLTRIETLEKQVKELKEPDYDALAQIIMERIDIDSSTPSYDEERLDAIEQEVAQLKNASTMENIGSYTHSSSYGSTTATFEYDNEGRLTKATGIAKYGGGTETTVFTFTYNDNVCTITSDQGSYIFTLSNENSRNFKLINDIMVSWTL